MRITTMIDGAFARITPHGPIDHEALPELRAAVAVLPYEVTSVVWDLSDVPFMDVAGLHLLFGRPPEDIPEPPTAAVTGLGPQPLRLLQLAAQTYPPLESAVTSTCVPDNDSVGAGQERPGPAKERHLASVEQSEGDEKTRRIGREPVGSAGVMTGSSHVTFHEASGHVMLVCLSGSLGADSCDDLARGLQQHLGQAARRGQRLVLDVSGIQLLSSAARRTLALSTDHLAHLPVLIVGARPHLRQVLERGNLHGIRLHDHLVDAVTALDTAPQRKARAPKAKPKDRADASEPAEALLLEMFGLRAKARTHALIGMAEGMLMTRYDLQRPAEAFALLREASQHRNVPMRVLASAVITAPAPQADTEFWFPGRATRPSAPTVGFLHAHNAKAADRRKALTAALYEIVTVSFADAVALHLTDPGQDDALILEQQHALDATLRDHAAHVVGPPAPCARAQEQGQAVTVPDIAEDPALSAHPAGQALLDAGLQSAHSIPLLNPDGLCNGTMTLHWSKPGFWLNRIQARELDVLASDIAAWRSWYRRTVLLDALEYLHQHHTAGKPSESIGARPVRTRR
ncbi:ANTAR domain-containing protein [Streptomyces sp. NPDC060011]|uniref:ANTAR domain-containing protein n=1 Tax=Streptomyces sp. NPDC060011 TaxID=3347037 RepID=UPI003676FC6B